MARWHLTSSQLLHERASRICDGAGLESSAELDDGSAFVRCYAKRVVQGTNFRSFGPDDWICAAGTMLTDGQFGAGALDQAYDRFVTDGLDATRSQLLGHYAVAVRNGDRITVFTDDQGSLSLYYKRAGNDYVISNSLQVVLGLQENPTVDPIALLAAALQGGVAGEETFAQGMKRLFGSQIIEIDVPSGGLAIRHIPQAMERLADSRDLTMDEAVALYQQRVLDVFDQVKGADSIGLNATGGLDTRTLLAALLNRGATPTLMYGVGNSTLTNTRTPDLDAVKALARARHLPFHQMDWTGRQPHRADKLSALFERYGYDYTTSGSSDSFLNELEGGIPEYPSLHLGGYSPALTNMKIWESESKQHLFMDLANHYLSPLVGALAPKTRTAYKEYIVAAVKEALTRSPVDFPENGADLDTFVRARLFLYIRPESQNANFFNEFSYYLAPFLTKRLYDPLLTLPLEYRQGDQFQLRLIDSLCPALLQVPVFSGVRAQELDLESFTMSRTDMSNSSGTGQPGLKRFVPVRIKDGTKRLLARLKLRHLSPAEVRAKDAAKDAAANKAIRKDSTKYVLSHPVLSELVSDPDQLDLRRLYKLHQLAFGVDEAGVEWDRSASLVGPS